MSASGTRKQSPSKISESSLSAQMKTRSDDRVYAAISRKSVKEFSGEGWYPEQAVSRAGPKMFTIWLAYAAFEENDKGSIESGKLADFTVLSRDIMKIPDPEILNTHSVMTVIGGEVAFEDRQSIRFDETQTHLQ